MDDVVIIGAGYSDLFDIIEDINFNKKIINVVAIVDSKRWKLKEYNSFPIVKNFEKIKFKKKPYIVNGVGSSNQNRLSVYQYFKGRFKLYNLIHPSLKRKNFNLGEGNIICEQVFIGKRVKLGNNNLISPQVFLGHDVKINNNCIFAPTVKIMGNVKIESDVNFGCGSLVLQKLKIGKGSLISMGSAVFSDIPRYMKTIVNPARCIKKI
jgi:sugar O-acyltransferase (sialic acid O-acetyltransferase NeuD family)